MCLGIHYGGPNVTVTGNIVNNTMMTLSDGGGLYGYSI